MKKKIQKHGRVFVNIVNFKSIFLDLNKHLKMSAFFSLFKIFF